MGVKNIVGGGELQGWCDTPCRHSGYATHLSILKKVAPQPRGPPEVRIYMQAGVGNPINHPTTRLPCRAASEKRSRAATGCNRFLWRHPVLTYPEPVPKEDLDPAPVVLPSGRQ